MYTLNQPSYSYYDRTLTNTATFKRVYARARVCVCASLCVYSDARTARTGSDKIMIKVNQLPVQPVPVCNTTTLLSRMLPLLMEL